MKNIFLFFVALLVASVAWAVDDTTWPKTIIDSTCTDSYDTLAWGTGTVYVQTSGSADTLCDHDYRILKGPITADTVFLMPQLPPGSHGIMLFIDADTVSNDTDAWGVLARVYRPHEPGLPQTLTTTGSKSAEGNYLFAIGPPLYIDPAYSGATHLDVAFPMVPFHFYLNLITATSWGGNISWMVY